MDRFENGRRYYNRADVTYVLPNDNKESERVHKQHWVIKVAHGGNYRSPITDELNKGILVHDAGCGPGTWTLEMAKDFPHSTFIGTDVSVPSDLISKPDNCEFKVHNLAKEGFFPENYFNFIHQRLLVMGILEKDWEKVIKEHVRTLAPGGWIECMEFAFHRAHNAGPHNDTLVRAYQAMCKAKGLFAEIPDHLEEMFRRAGLVNIEVKEVYGPMDQETEYGRLAWEDFREAFIALKPLIVKMNPELNGDETYQKFLEDCLKEFTELGTAQIGYRIWGQKPTETDEVSTE
ncbi:S-adenosyl-L-methionine-dependent methyltransferase [Dichotomocladium elegans]|nr:S-adenosyl-L-methionine-dependent methyltransferase [Dichotomocladium elegans]